MIKKVAITGGIAEGKSTVASFLANMGVEVISADEIARHCLESKEVKSQIQNQLGLAANFSRINLRDAITGNDIARRNLNSIIHPLVVERILESDADVYEVPLLIESCLMSLFQSIWVVTCGPKLQLERLTSRLNDGALAQKTISLQLDSEVKCAFADHIIRTDEPLSSVQSVVEALARSTGLVQ